MKYLARFILLLPVLGGCATTYIPISREYRAKVETLSRSDLALSILFDRFDPQRHTLRSRGDSFNETMWPSEVPHHLGAYRTDTDLIYTNLYLKYTDEQLRELLHHELAHHIWFKTMSEVQRDGWMKYLEENPSPDQEMVRRTYLRPEEFSTEDFAFTIQHARVEDLKELLFLNLLSAEDCTTLLAELVKTRQAGSARAALHDSAFRTNAVTE